MKISKAGARNASYIFAELSKKTKLVEETTGISVLDLAAGNVSVPPSDELMKLLSVAALDPTKYRYPGYDATLGFEQALQAYYQRRYQVELTQDQLQPVLGAKEGIASLTLSLCDPGDEVLVPNPGYPAYSGVATVYGIKPVPYNLSQENGFSIDFRGIKSKITSRTKCIWVNFPSNPTGKMANREELRRLVALCAERKIWLLFDHAYDQIIFSSQRSISILEIPRSNEIAIELGSFSKSYSLAGLRMGWVVGNEKVISALRKVKSQVDSGMSLMLQDLGTHALNTQDSKWIHSTLTTYKQKQLLVAKLLDALGVSYNKPEAGLYIWGKVPSAFSSGEDFAEYLLTEKQILVVPGSAYGSQGKKYIRASFAPDISGIERYI